MDELYMDAYGWSERYGFRIKEPEGWRHPFVMNDTVYKYASMLDLISEREFWCRASVSTCEGLTKKAVARMHELTGDAIQTPAEPPAELWDGAVLTVKGARLVQANLRPWDSVIYDRVQDLLRKWTGELSTYPIHESSEAKYAHKTLELCIQELQEVVKPA